MVEGIKTVMVKDPTRGNQVSLNSLLDGGHDGAAK